MPKTEQYVDLRGHVYMLSGLTEVERALVRKLRRRANAQPDWSRYRNFWQSEVERFYGQLGLTRRQMLDSIGYRIGQDLGSRLAVAQGRARRPDYRDELEQLILSRFRSRREFCDATGLSQDMLSHVLAKRKHLAIDTLAGALEKIGYTIHIVPQRG